MWIMVDIEADGPAPGYNLYSMVQIGAIIVEPSLNRTFYGELAPISPNFSTDALKSFGITRKITESYPSAATTMKAFDKWINSISENNRPLFISDNNGFDWMFVCWYLWEFNKSNPFGHSSANLGSLYKGCVKNVKQNFKYLRKTKHTHNPVDDAKGNAEAFLEINNRFNLGIHF